MKKVVSYMMILVMVISLSGCLNKEVVSVNVESFNVIERVGDVAFRYYARGEVSLTNNTNKYLTNYPMLSYLTDESGMFVENSVSLDEVTLEPHQTIVVPYCVYELNHEYQPTQTIDLTKAKNFVLKVPTWDEFDRASRHIARVSGKTKPDIEYTKEKFNDKLSYSKSKKPEQHKAWLSDEMVNTAYFSSLSFSQAEITSVKMYDVLNDTIVKLKFEATNVTDQVVDINGLQVVVVMSQNEEVVARHVEVSGPPLKRDDDGNIIRDENGYIIDRPSKLEPGESHEMEVTLTYDALGILSVDGKQTYRPEDLTYNIEVSPNLWGLLVYRV